MLAIPLPLPGFKLGLANIAVLFCLYKLGVVDAAAVLGLRIALVGLLFGSPVSLILSATGGLTAFLTALVLHRIKRLTPIGVSVASSAAHMAGQICAAAVILKTPELFTSYLPYLLLLSVPTGALNGWLAEMLIKRVNYKK